MNDGIHAMSAEDYHASPAVSNSDLKYITGKYTPAHFWAFKDRQIEREETEAMRIGTLTHRCILEPDTMRDSYAVKPDGMTFASKDGKAWRDAHEGLTIISQSHADMIERMMSAVWSHHKAKQIIMASKREQSLFATDGPVQLRARIDCLPENGNIIADLKTTELCDLDSVESAIFTYGYYRQAAFYLRLANLLGLKKEKFILIFVEKTPPHCVAVYSLDDIAIEAGTAEVRSALSLIKNCTTTGIWPGRDDGINDASLPNWAIKRIENHL